VVVGGTPLEMLRLGTYRNDASAEDVIGKPLRVDALDLQLQCVACGDADTGGKNRHKHRQPTESFFENVQIFLLVDVEREPDEQSIQPRVPLDRQPEVLSISHRD